MPGTRYRVGEHHGKLRHTLTMPAGITRLVVYRGIDELNECLEQFFRLPDKTAICQRNGRLRCERFD